MVSITVIGVPEDGCISLTSRAVNAASSARVLAGHPRHREWFPQFSGQFLDMTQGFSSWLNAVLDESEEGEVVVLASGDPLFFGIGKTLLKHLSPQELAFIPSFSSAQLAFSKLGIPWDQAQYISCHGRELSGLVARMQHGSLFAILTDHFNSPQRIAQHLRQFNQTGWTLYVCEQLGGTQENIRQFDIEQLAECELEFDALNIVIAQRDTASSRSLWGGNGQFASDESFLKRMPQNGLITKQAVRNLALTTMRIGQQDTVWDIGAGSGSISIEAAKFATHGQVFAIECNQTCFESIQANIHAHATDNVKLKTGKAPEALIELPSPDAVFVGGSRGAMDTILTTAWQALNPQARLVVSAVTMDTVVEIYQWAKQQGLDFDTQLINVSNTQPLAHYQRYQAENPIHLFSFVKTNQSQGDRHE